MTTSLPTARQGTFMLGVLAAALLFAEVGCKPSPSAGTGQTTPDAGSASRQPSADDAKNFVQSLLPSTVRLTDFKADVPLRQPNTAPEGNSWTVIRGVVGEFNGDYSLDAELTH